jgi:hypothetical protein
MDTVSAEADDVGFPVGVNVRVIRAANIKSD